MHNSNVADHPSKNECKTVDGPQGQPKEHSTITWRTHKHTGNKDAKVRITQQIIIYSGETATPMKRDQDQDQTE
jgi:hypothetical protein